MHQEKSIESSLKRTVDKADGLCIKLIASFFTGLPDRLVLLPGARIYFIETKAKNGEPSPRQLYVHRLLRRLGFTVYIISNKTQLDEFKREIYSA